MKLLSFILGPVKTNSYFLIDEKTNDAVVIDPGIDGEGILRKLRERNLNVSLILLTHGHFDHTLALPVLLRHTAAKVAIHSHDNEMLLDPQKSFALQFTGEASPLKSADLLLEDGQVIAFHEKRIRVLHTPGHTKGSVCYCVDDLMFTGDTLFARGVGRTDLYGGDFETLTRSLQTVKSLTEDYKIYPGHGNSTRLSVERQHNAYLANNE